MRIRYNRPNISKHDKWEIQNGNQMSNMRSSWDVHIYFHRPRDVREVKRLMTDPPELCCPVSKELMEDPVVAGDGFLGL